jgi:hypothetical protein
MLFYKLGNTLFREHDPSFRKTPYRVDSTSGDSIYFDSLQESEQHIYLALDTADPITLTLHVDQPVGRWQKAA